MAHVIAFRSARFDVAGEPPNPINPIPGERLLRWLGQRLGTFSYEVTAPDAEDWGWYMDVRGAGAAYMIGASGEPDAGGQIAWTVQIHRHRSLRDKLTGANRLAADDPLSALVERLVREEAGAGGVEVSREP
jgi:hypothetical protein